MASDPGMSPQIEAQLLERVLTFGVPFDLVDAAERKLDEARVAGTPCTVVDVFRELGLPEPLLDAVDLDALTGRTVAGFELASPIGVGGMGFVFRARQESLDRDVAVKVLDPVLARMPTIPERFQREARIAARLHHPNVVQPIDFGTDDGLHYFAMEFLTGGSVESRVAGLQPIPEREALGIARDVAAALAFAGEHGVVHRDIKPANILFDAHGTTKLADLGLAILVDDTATRLTRQGVTLGSPNYMAPEQCLGEEPVDQRADIYALGITLYEMLSGRMPFNAPSAAALQQKHLHEPLPSIRAHLPRASEKTEALLARMCAKRPEDRFPDAAALVEAIEHALSDGAAPASSSPTEGAKESPAPSELEADPEAPTIPPPAVAPVEIARPPLPTWVPAVIAVAATGLVALFTWAVVGSSQPRSEPPATVSAPSFLKAPSTESVALLRRLGELYALAQAAQRQGKLEAALALNAQIVAAAEGGASLGVRSFGASALSSSIDLAERLDRPTDAIALGEQLEARYANEADSFSRREARRQRLERLRALVASGGERTIEPVSLLVEVSYAGRLVATDLNGDLRTDAVLTGEKPKFLFSRGRGLVLGETPPTPPLKRAQRVLGVVDVDRSGLAEIVTAPGSRAWPTAYELVSLNADRITPPVRLGETPRIARPSGCATRVLDADLDGDGRPELIFWRPRSPTRAVNQVSLRFGGPSFPPGAAVEVALVGEYELAFAARHSGRSKGDAVLLLLAESGRRGTVRRLVAFSGSADQLRKPLLVVEHEELESFAVGDWSGDGIDEIAVLYGARLGGSRTRRPVRVLLGRGNGRFQAADGVPFVEWDELYVTRLTLTDLDGDLRADLVAVGPSTRDGQAPALAARLSNGAGTFRPGPLTLLAGMKLPVHQLVPGDVDGDGKADLLLRGTDEVAVVFGDGGGGFVARPGR